MLQRKRPTAIGHADYYGVVANTAARMMALAPPGRTLIEGGLPFVHRHRWVHDVQHTLEVDLVDGDTLRRSTIRLLPLGRYDVKGLPTPVPIFEARALA